MDSLVSKFLRGYQPTSAESEALRACGSDALQRAAAGSVVAGGATAVLLRGRNASIAVRVGMLTLCSVIGGYAGALTAVRSCAERVLALENSPLANEARMVLYDYIPENRMRISEIEEAERTNAKPPQES